MSVYRSEGEQRFALESSGRQTEVRNSPDKWSARRSLLFLVGAASVLWAGIIFGATLIF